MAYVDSQSYDGRYYRFTVTQSGTSTTLNWTFSVIGGAELYYANSPISCTIGTKVVYSAAEHGWSYKTFPVAKGSTSGSYNVGSYGTYTITLSGRPYYSSATSKSTTITLTKPTYTITYNANGGENAPANQTKTYGTVLTLSSTIPTRASSVENGVIVDYTFKGWATSADATSATYQPSDSYTTNAALALYAVWEAVARVSLGKPSALVQSVIQNTATITLVHPEYEDGVTFGSWEVTTTSGTHHVSGDTLTVKWDKNETVLAHIRVIDSNGSKSEPVEVVCNVRKNGFCVYDKGRWKKVSPYIYRDGEYKRLNGAVYNEDGTWFKYYCRGTEVTYLTDASGDFLTDESGNVLKL